MPDPRPERRRAPRSQATAGAAGADVRATRFQRVASWLLIACLAVTVLGFASSLLYSAYGSTSGFFGSGFFQYAYALPLIALPLAAITLIAIVISAARQKSAQRR